MCLGENKGVIKGKERARKKNGMNYKNQFIDMTIVLNVVSNPGTGFPSSLHS